MINTKLLEPILRTGDLVFFGGDPSFVARAISFFTRSKYNHVGVVYRSAGGDTWLMEATAFFGGKRGVQSTLLSERVATYPGYIDLAMLKAYTRAEFDALACAEFLTGAEGKPYDFKGALLSGVGQWLRIPGWKHYDEMFCSELADAALRAGGLHCGKDKTPTPHEISQRPIFQKFIRLKEGGKQ
jgi:hypothetical protein